ncbi:probable glycosyl transferase [Richelia intracellularis]|nr:probable glycosyl transferase [Richelia intracellularis]
MAMKEANGPFVGFLDDDSYPELTWVDAAYKFAQNHTHIGAYGSQIYPQWEVEPPASFIQLAPFLAITERGNQPLLYHRSQKLLPPSAGLIINKQAWFESMPKQTILSGIISGNMLTGEDIEVLAHIQKAGWKIWYNPAMEIYHQIPQWRLTSDYLIPFFKGIGLSRYVTSMIDVKPWLRTAFFFGYIMNDLRKIIRNFC